METEWLTWTHGIHYYSSTGPDGVMPCLKALWRIGDVEHSCRAAAHLDQHSRRLNYLRSGRGGAWEGGRGRRKGEREEERRGGRDRGDKEERGIQSTKVVASVPDLPCLRVTCTF